MASAMLFHGLWDSAGALVQGKNALIFPLFIIMIAAALTLVVRAFRMTAPRERQFLRDILALRPNTASSPKPNTASSPMTN
ncbi:hypothetical protein [Rhodococcus sp. ARC_M6]|uniref:hypothetical protein n=1 Tax=Rhodococcus sp. ARC_M6 TaxID=2928852 RepID=UPI0027E0444F|nr:hypothetical protein [Rhodococcus sp. ARC_M6]